MSDPPPRRRPPWWPEGETWPPRRRPPWGRHRSSVDGSGELWSRDSSDWRHGRGGRFFRPFGCLFLVLVLFATGMLTIGIWAIAAILGLVSAPPVVTAGGVAALLLVGIAIVTAARAIRRMTAPLDDLIDAAGRVEAGDYSVRVRESGSRDLRSLARAFNAMSSRLADADTQRRTFLADMAHELRTPLTVIHGHVEAFADGVYAADAEHLGTLLDQTRTLEQLVDDLRTVALAEAGSLQLAREEVDPGALVDDSIAAFRRIADSAGVQLVGDVDPALSAAFVDPGRIRQVLGNLISNAIQHTPPGGEVRVRAQDADGGFEVVVSDTGTGITPELLPRIFDRFAKEPGSAGSGLGLAIARDLVEAHGGVISADRAVKRGTRITFTLPHLGEA
jgi:two-component system, OmpR family, sensor histidine kinase BaeS